MEKLLVILHIYYPDQIDYFLNKLENIVGIEWDFFVTHSSLDIQSINKIKKFKPSTKFIKVRNVGYDIWPFISAIQDINLEEYDYVMKLHTKREVSWCRPNIIALRGMEWRNALVDGLLYNSEYFAGIINKFHTDKKIGMISSLLSYVSRDYYDKLVINELHHLGLKKKDKHTNMGTMFIVRADALQPLQSTLINQAIFEDFVPVSGVDFHNAHLYERILSHLAINAGYKHIPMWPHKRDRIIIRLCRILEPIGKFIFTCEREGPEQNKYVRIFGIKIYKEKKKVIKR